MKTSEAYKYALRDKKKMDDFHKKNFIQNNKNDSDLNFSLTIF
jgi:hypothetical protein